MEGQERPFQCNNENVGKYVREVRGCEHKTKKVKKENCSGAISTVGLEYFKVGWTDFKCRLFSYPSGRSHYGWEKVHGSEYFYEYERYLKKVGRIKCTDCDKNIRYLPKYKRCLKARIADFNTQYWYDQCDDTQDGFFTDRDLSSVECRTTPSK